MLQVPELSGRSAIVTGAASGIGMATCHALARNGASVVCVDLTDPQPTVDSIVSEGGTAIAAQADVSDLGQIGRAADSAIAAYGKLDIGVNCAGIIDEDILENLQLADWERVLRVNLTGTYAFAKAVLEPISTDGDGRLVLFASIAARTGGVQSGPAYAASKGGVVAFMKWAARHYAARKVTVNAVAPGPIVTPLIEGRGYGAESIPLARLGSPEELAQAVVYLCSDAGSWITGHTLDVNGGLYMNQCLHQLLALGGDLAVHPLACLLAQSDIPIGWFLDAHAVTSTCAAETAELVARPDPLLVARSFMGDPPQRELEWPPHLFFSV